MKALINIVDSAAGNRLHYLSRGATEQQCRERAWRNVHQRQFDADGGEYCGGRIVEMAPELIDMLESDDLEDVYKARETMKLVGGVLHCKYTSSAPSDDLALSFDAAADTANAAERARLDRQEQDEINAQRRQILDQVVKQAFWAPGVL